MLFRSMLEADSLCHSFATDTTLSLHEYIDKKIALYNEAGEMDEDAKARRLVMGVDPALSKLIDVHRFGVTIDEIKAQLSAREWAARRDWSNQQDQVKSSQDHVTLSISVSLRSDVAPTCGVKIRLTMIVRRRTLVAPSACTHCTTMGTDRIVVYTHDVYR